MTVRQRRPPLSQCFAVGDSWFTSVWRLSYLTSEPAPAAKIGCSYGLHCRGCAALARRAVGGFARNDIRCRPSRERSGFLRRVYASGYMVDGHVDGDFQRAT